MKVLVLGIGNILMGDEGIGVQAVMCLQMNYRFEGDAQVDLIDGGTLAHQLIPTMAQYDHLIIIDAIRATGANPGELYFFDLDAIPPSVQWKSTVHEVEMLQSLSMMDLLGDRPKTYILGVVPLEITGLSFQLTNEVQNAYPQIETTLTGHLGELGITASKVDSYPLDAIASVLQKRWELSSEGTMA